MNQLKLSKIKQSTQNIFREVFIQLKNLVLGKLLLALIIGIISWIGFTAIGVPYPVLLAILNGVLDLIPIIGPILSIIITVILSLILGKYVEAMLALVFLIVLQQIETWILEPWILKKSVNINPFLSIGIIIVSTVLLGPVGTILAIPSLIVFKVIWEKIHPNQNNLK